MSGNALIKNIKLPIAQQVGLTAVKLQMFGGKTSHFWHPRTCLFAFRVHE